MHRVGIVFAIIVYSRTIFIKNPYFGGSRSFKVIDVGTPGELVSSACYDKQQLCFICNRFHATRANSGKITISMGVPLFDALVRGESSHPAVPNYLIRY